VGVNGVLRWRAGDKVLYFTTAYGEGTPLDRTDIYLLLLTGGKGVSPPPHGL
jgi:hypothetical protein